MAGQFERTELLLGEEAMKALAAARVAVFGVGGVGGYVAEALARCGVGTIDLIDNDRVSLTNLNRQIVATHRTLGRDKVDVMRDRILDINPDAAVNVHKCFFLPETEERFDFAQYSYVVDAVDTVTAKIELILRAQAAGTPVISSMGAGNKLDPTRFEVADIYETSVCPLARIMRKELKKRNVKSLKVVYSKEEPLRPRAKAADEEDGKDERYGKDEKDGDRKDCGQSRKRDIPGSVAFVPSVAGLIIAGEVVKDLTHGATEKRGDR